MTVRASCTLADVGLVSALGAGRSETWQRLLDGDQSRFRLRDDLAPQRRLLVGEVVDPLPEIPEHLARYACRNTRLALAALQQIEPAARAALRDLGPQRVGVIVGTSTSGAGDAEEALRHRAETGGLAPSFDYAQLEFGGTAGFVAEYLGALGPVYALSTACSSGARALAAARSLLALDLCDAVVAGAADSLCGLTANGFCELTAVSDELTNPLSLHRRGLTLGEGAALFLVTRGPGGIELCGAGESSDAHHMSAPDPSGAGAETAMRAALRDAGADPSDIAYLNLHGTGTEQNDRMECGAVARVLGEDVPCSSTKPLVGHTLGAAGALEAAFCWLLLDAAEGGALSLPPHCWDGQRDPELAALRLAGKGERVAAGARPLVMTNSFGFGGNNCTLILGRGGESARAARPAREVSVLSWSAWAPGHEDDAAWRSWAREPGPLPAEGHPEARFLPALLRRRCTPLTRIALHSAFACCRGRDPASVRTVFASRHGCINESIALLETVVRGGRLSPAAFSHTVHNVQAGLFSIAAGNRCASSSLAAMEDTFGAGWAEALGHLERDPETPVLLVSADVPLAPDFAPLVDEPAASYGLALLLGSAGPGPRVRFGPEEGAAPAPRAWPDALEFLRWLLSDEAHVTLGGRRTRWTWRRG